MRILVTGAAGSIGSELVRQCAANGDTVYCLDNNEVAVFDQIEELKLEGKDVCGRVGDIRNTDTLETVFSDFKPELVFHAAAYKCVTPMEQEPKESIDVNVIGTYNVMSAAKRHGVERLVYISTDKAASMNCVMGASKKMGEILARNFGYVAVRFGNVIGSRGSVIPLWQSQMSKGLPITITDERCERFFMSISDAVGLVREAASVGKPGEVMILDMGEPLKIIDVAKRILEDNPHRNHGYRIIGLRPGEYLTERLMTEEEEKRAERRGKFFVIG